MTTWKEIISKPGWNDLDLATKQEVRNQWISEDVAPTLTDDPDRDAVLQELYNEPLDTGEGLARSMFGSAARGFLDPLAAVPEVAGAYTGIESLEELGGDIRSGIERLAPVNPAQQGLLTDIAGVAGQVGQIAATGGLGAASGMALAGKAATKAAQLQAARFGATAAQQGAMGASAVAGGLERADQLGLEGGNRLVRGLLAGGTELATEKLGGFATELGPVNKLLGDSIESGFMKPVIRGILTESGEEGAAEVAGQATDIAMAPETAPAMDLKQIGYSMLLGGAGGAMFGGVEAAIAPRTAQAYKDSGAFVPVRNIADLPSDIDPNDDANLVYDSKDNLIGYKPKATEATVETELPYEAPIEINVDEQLPADVRPEVEAMVSNVDETPETSATAAALAEDTQSGIYDLGEADATANLLTGVPMQQPLGGEQQFDNSLLEGQPIEDEPLQETPLQQEQSSVEAVPQPRELPILPAEPTAQAPEAAVRADAAVAEQQKVTKDVAESGAKVDGGGMKKKEQQSPDELLADYSYEIALARAKSKDATGKSLKALKKEGKAAYDKRTRENLRQSHIDSIRIAAGMDEESNADFAKYGMETSRNPVSAEAVDSYGIKLPDGYVKTGELYVFQPISPEPTGAVPTESLPAGQPMSGDMGAAVARDAKKDPKTGGEDKYISGAYGILPDINVLDIRSDKTGQVLERVTWSEFSKIDEQEPNEWKMLGQPYRANQKPDISIANKESALAILNQSLETLDATPPPQQQQQPATPATQEAQPKAAASATQQPAEETGDAGVTSASAGAKRRQEAIDAGLDARTADGLGAATDMAEMARQAQSRTPKQQKQDWLDYLESDFEKFKENAPRTAFESSLFTDDQYVRYQRNKDGSINVVADETMWSPQGETRKPKFKKGTTIRKFKDVDALFQFIKPEASGETPDQAAPSAAQAADATASGPSQQSPRRLSAKETSLLRDGDPEIQYSLELTKAIGTAKTREELSQKNPRPKRQQEWEDWANDQYEYLWFKAFAGADIPNDWASSVNVARWLVDSGYLKQGDIWVKPSRASENPKTPAPIGKVSKNRIGYYSSIATDELKALKESIASRVDDRLRAQTNRSAWENNEPVVASAVEKYGIKLPENYIKKGRFYVPSDSIQGDIPSGIQPTEAQGTPASNLGQEASQRLRADIATLPAKSQAAWTPELLAIADSYYQSGDRSLLDKLPKSQRNRILENSISAEESVALDIQRIAERKKREGKPIDDKLTAEEAVRRSIASITEKPESARAKAIQKGLAGLDWANMDTEQRRAAVSKFAQSAARSLLNGASNLKRDAKLTLHEDRSPSAKFDVSNGSLSIEIGTNVDFDGLSFRDSEEAVLSQVFAAIEEEFMHAAHGIAAFERWKKSGSETEFRDWFEQESFKDWQSIFARISELRASGNNEAANTIEDTIFEATKLYHQDVPLEMLGTLMQQQRPAYKMYLELARMLAQVQLDSFTTETEFTRFVKAVNHIFTKVLGLMRKSAELVKTGALGEALKRDVDTLASAIRQMRQDAALIEESQKQPPAATYADAANDPNVLIDSLGEAELQQAITIRESKQNESSQTPKSQGAARVDSSQTSNDPSGALARSGKGVAGRSQESRSVERRNSILRQNDGSVIRTGVTVRAAEAARNSYTGVIPGIDQTWLGTAAEFQEQHPDGIDWGDGKLMQPDANAEAGVAADGRSYIFTDRVQLLEGDMKRAEQYGTTPQGEAVKRLLRHESFGHRGAMSLPAPLRNRFVDMIASGVIPEAELDYIVNERGYSTYAGWRNDIAKQIMLGEEWLAHKMEGIRAIPQSGPMAQMMDWLRDVWAWLTGSEASTTGDKLLPELRDMMREMHRALGALKPQQRVVEGGVRASLSAKDSLRVKMTRKAMTEAALSQSEWKDWYEEHQETLDEFFGDHAQQFQDILSVTSQAASVKANVGLALKAFGQWHRGEDFVGFLPAVIQNLNRLRDKTQIQGQKISAYKKNNDGTVDEAVIDRHIARLVFGVDSPSKAQFEKAQKILSEVAKNVGWTPRQVQAALWAHSIYKSGKTPESYGNYLKKLESKGTLVERIGSLTSGGSRGDGTGGGRGRFAPASAGTGGLGSSQSTSNDIRYSRQGPAPIRNQPAALTSPETKNTAPNSAIRSIAEMQAGLDGVMEVLPTKYHPLAEKGGAQDALKAYADDLIAPYKGSVEKLRKLLSIVKSDDLLSSELKIGARSGSVVMPSLLNKAAILAAKLGNEPLRMAFMRQQTAFASSAGQDLWANKAVKMDTEFSNNYVNIAMDDTDVNSVKVTVDPLINTKGDKTVNDTLDNAKLAGDEAAEAVAAALEDEAMISMRVLELGALAQEDAELRVLLEELIATTIDLGELAEADIGRASIAGRRTPLKFANAAERDAAIEKLKTRQTEILAAIKARIAKPKKPKAPKTEAATKGPKAPKEKQPAKEKEAKPVQTAKQIINKIIAAAQRKEKKPADIDKVRELYKLDLKKPMDEADFVAKAKEAGLDAPLAVELKDAIDLELTAIAIEAEFRAAEKKQDKEVRTLESEMAKMLRTRSKFLDIDSSALAAFVNKLRAAGQLKGTDKIKWADILSLPVADQETVRANLIKRVSKHEVLKNLTPAQQEALADALDAVWQRERRKIFKRMIKRADMKGVDKATQEKIANATPALLKFINQGMLGSDAFYLALGEQFNIQRISKEDRAKVEQLAAEMQAPDVTTMERTIKSEQIAKILQKNSTMSYAELASSVWVVHVLTGGATLLDMGLGFMTGTLSVIKKAINVAAIGKPGLALEGLSDFGRFLYIAGKEAVGNVVRPESGILAAKEASMMAYMQKGAMGAGLTPGDRLQLIRDEPGDSASVKANKKIQRTLGRWLSMWERIMGGLDHFNSVATTHGTMRLAAALNPKLYDEALIPSQQDYKNMLVRAKAKLPDGSAKAQTSLARSMIYDGIHLLGKGLEEGKMEQWRRMVFDIKGEGYTASFQEEPSGLGGILYNGIKSMTDGLEVKTREFRDKQREKFKETRGVGPATLINRAAGEIGYVLATQAQNIMGSRFIRFTGNKLNELISYTPFIGLARLQEAGMSRDGLTNLRAKNIYHNQALSIVALIAYMYMMQRLDDDEEEKKVIVEGSWDNLTPARKSQLMSDGFKPNTIRFKMSNGQWVSGNFTSWPFAGWLAAFGTVSDYKRYTPDKWTEKEAMDKTMLALYSGAFAITDISSLSQLMEMFGKSTYSTDPVKTANERFVKGTTSFLGGFFPRIAKDIDSWFDHTAYKPKDTWEHLAKEVPYLRRSSGAPIRDIFYEKVEVTRSPWSRAIKVSPDDPAYQKLARLNAKGIWLTPPNPENRKVRRGGATRALTEDEAAAYMSETGAKYKEFIMKRGDALAKMDADRAADLIEKTTARIREIALKRAIARGGKAVTVEAE